MKADRKTRKSSRAGTSQDTNTIPRADGGSTASRVRAGQRPHSKPQAGKKAGGVSDLFMALNVDGICTHAHGNSMQIFGCAPDSLIGRHIWTEFPASISQSFHQACRAAMQTQQPVFIEEYDLAQERWFENRVHPTMDGLSIFLFDITDRKEAELKAGRHYAELQTIFDISRHLQQLETP